MLLLVTVLVILSVVLLLNKSETVCIISSHFLTILRLALIVQPLHVIRCRTKNNNTILCIITNNRDIIIT